MTNIELFGQFFKKMRQKTGLTLRQFCLKHDLDPGNISKIERGILPPPTSRQKIETYAKYLNIKPQTEDWYNFFDIAAASSGTIPSDVMNDENLVRKLPLIFRTLRGQNVPPEKLNELAELIRRT